MSGSFEILIKLGKVPGHRLDYVFSAKDKLRVINASGLFSWKVTLNVLLLVTNRSSGHMIMLGRKIRSDPVSNLFTKQDDWALAKLERNRVGKLVKAARADFVKEQHREFKSDPKKFWKTISSVIQSNKQSQNTIRLAK